MGHMSNGVVAVDEGLGKRVSMDAPVLKYKKRRISAVRDFPPGCGRTTATVNGEVNGARAVGDVVDKAGDVREQLVSVKPTENSVDVNASDMAGGLDHWESPHLSKSFIDEITMVAEDIAKVEAQEPVDTLESMKGDTSSFQSPVEAVLPEKPAEEVSNHLQSPVTVDAAVEIVQKRIYCKRKVSACRDFPPGCGRNAASVNLKSFRKSVDSSKGRVLRDSSCEDDNVEQNVRASVKQGDGKVQAGESLKSTVKEKKSEDRLPVNGDQNVRASVKQGDGKVQAGESLKSTIKEKKSEDRLPVNVEQNVRASVKQGDGKVQARESLKSTIKENTIKEKKSEDRLPVNLKSFRKSVDSSKGRALCESSCEDDNVEQNVKADVKQGDTKVQAGNSLKSTIKEKKTEDRLPLKSESMLKKQKTEQVHRKETGIKHPHDSGISRPESPFTKTVDRVDGSSGGDSGMESVNLSKNMAFERKIPGKSMNEIPRVSQSQGKPHVVSFDDRVIVQSIMAKPNCPWPQGKKTLTPVSSNRLQVDQGKKNFNSFIGKGSLSEQGKIFETPDGDGSQSEQGKKTFKTPDGNGSQREQGKQIFKSPTGSQARASESDGSKLPDDRVIVLSLMAARNCPWRLGKKSIKSSGGQAKQR